MIASNDSSVDTCGQLPIDMIGTSSELVLHDSLIDEALLVVNDSMVDEVDIEHAFSAVDSQDSASSVDIG